MFSYLMVFVLLNWAPHPNDVHRLQEMAAITQDILSTDATPEEALVLENIAALESGFERSAVGRHNEQSAWQIMPPAKSYNAR